MRAPLLVILLGVAVCAAVVGMLALLRGTASRDHRTTRAQPEPEAVTGAQESLSQESTAVGIADSDSQALPEVLVDPSVVVEKRMRRLTVFSAGEPVKGYRIALGAEPLGDKEREGDARTPEGEYYVCTRNPASKYHRSMGLSYPNALDADRGLQAGLITSREHRAIADALRHMRQPPWKTRLGGEIMIHGGGTHADWTDGCIALSDGEAEELFTALPLGTVVEILP